jgi:hypothetical protein
LDQHQWVSSGERRGCRGQTRDFMLTSGFYVAAWDAISRCANSTYTQPSLWRKSRLPCCRPLCGGGTRCHGPFDRIGRKRVVSSCAVSCSTIGGNGSHPHAGRDRVTKPGEPCRACWYRPHRCVLPGSAVGNGPSLHLDTKRASRGEPTGVPSAATHEVPERARTVCTHPGILRFRGSARVVDTQLVEFAPGVARCRLQKTRARDPGRKLSPLPSSCSSNCLGPVLPSAEGSVSG